MDCLGIINPVQNQQWNRFINNHPNGRIYHTGEWKSILEESFNHLKGYYFVLHRNNVICAALPIYFVHSWITGKRFISIPFATLCDPLVSSVDEMYFLFDGILQFTKKFSIKQIEIRTVNCSQILKQTGIMSVSRYVHHYLLLDNNIENIYAKFHRTCIRQRISRAQKSNIKINFSNSENEFYKFHNLYLITRKRIGLPPQPLLFIHNLWKKFNEQNQAKIVLAEKDNKTIAGLLLLLFKRTVTVEFAVVDKQYDSISPLHLLFWDSIKFAHREGYKCVDFGRTPVENSGLINFKNRWGTESVKLNFFYFPESSFRNQLKIENSFSYKILNQMIRATPKFILSPIGKMMYSHFS